MYTLKQFWDQIRVEKFPEAVDSQLINERICFYEGVIVGCGVHGEIQAMGEGDRRYWDGVIGKELTDFITTAAPVVGIGGKVKKAGGPTGLGKVAALVSRWLH